MRDRDLRSTHKSVAAAPTASNQRGLNPFDLRPLGEIQPRRDRMLDPGRSKGSSLCASGRIEKAVAFEPGALRRFPFGHARIEGSKTGAGCRCLWPQTGRRGIKSTPIDRILPYIDRPRARVETYLLEAAVHHFFRSRSSDPASHMHCSRSPVASPSSADAAAAAAAVTTRPGGDGRDQRGLTSS